EHDDRSCVGKIDEDLPSPSADLEAFRMCRQCNVFDLDPGYGVDHCQSARAITHIHARGLCIEANVVGVAIKGLLARWCEIVTLEHADSAVPNIRHKQHIDRGNIAHALWLA